MNISEFIGQVKTQEFREASAHMENMVAFVYGVKDLVVKEVYIKPEDDAVIVYTGSRGIDSLISFPMRRVFAASMANVEVYFGDLPDDVPEPFQRAICSLTTEMGVCPVIRHKGLAVSISIQDVRSSADIANAFEMLRELCHGLAKLLEGNKSDLLVPSSEDAVHCAASKEIH